MIFVVAVATSALAGEFSGIYAGVNLGGASGGSNATTTTIFSPTGYFATTSPGAIAIAGRQKLEPSSFVGGGQAGANFQIGHIVLGGEVDFGHMQLSQQQSKSGIYPCCPTTGFTVTQSVRTDWLFTARPRVGVAFGRVMLYGTGGVAVTDFNYKANFIDTFATAAENGGVNENRSGWIAGGGVEFRLAHHWSVKGEVLHADFDRVTTTSTNLTAFSPPIPFPTNVWTHHASLKATMGRMGINFRF
jgi:outer membrane immunogenic protein